MNTRNQLIGAWCGPAFMALMALGWVFVAGYFPPHSPTWNPSEVVAWYQANPIRIRLGLLLFLWASALYMPFTAVLSNQLKRIEGPNAIWAWVQLGSGIGNVVTVIFPMAFWATAAFRPDRAPELIQLLDDLAWIPWVCLTSPWLLTPISIAIVGLMDKSEHPTFPRWACYYQIWALLLIMPGGLIIFFQTGPFAWNGLFGIWIPFIDWGVWFCVTTYLLIKGIKRQAQEALAERAGSV